MNDRKKIFFSSDFHFYHKNSLNFDNRPFRDIEHMHNVIVNNHNATVPKDGVTYMLGDIGMGSFEGLKKLINSMNGTKILIIGNHDGNPNRMYRMGFDVVLYNATLMIAGEVVTLSHCPLTGVYREDTTGMNNSVEGENWHREVHNRKFSVINDGQFHLSGHLHSQKKDIKLDKQWDIGVVGNNYTPVSISAVESWISKYNKNNK